MLFKKSPVNQLFYSVFEILQGSPLPLTQLHLRIL